MWILMYITSFLLKTSSGHRHSSHALAISVFYIGCLPFLWPMNIRKLLDREHEVSAPCPIIYGALTCCRRSRDSGPIILTLDAASAAHCSGSRVRNSWLHGPSSFCGSVRWAFRSTAQRWDTSRKKEWPPGIPVEENKAWAIDLFL